MASSGTTAIVVLHDLDIYFQGQTFSCYEFVINKLCRQRMSQIDFHQLARLSREVALVSSFGNLATSNGRVLISSDRTDNY